MANAAPSPRYGHVGVWTGSEMIVWGGTTGGVVFVNNGARYNPVTHAWKHLPTEGAPSPGAYTTGVWTGQELIIWNSQDADGARYDPATDRWTPMSTAGAPKGFGATAVWSGSEMIVWGGYAAGVPGGGARYDPATDTWRPMTTANVPTLRTGDTAIWTGRRMLIWGGTTTTPPFAHVGDGAAYDPATDTWTPLAGAGAPTARYDSAAVWTGTTMLVWGGTVTDYKTAHGCMATPCGGLSDGGAYNPSTDTWTALPLTPLPRPRYGQTAVWTGSKMLVWGGTNGLTPFGDGAAYDPNGTVLPSAVPHDDRYFAPTGYRIDNAVIWDYFQKRGGLATFGYPVSRTFRFQGFLVQFFQRRIVQLDSDGQPRLLNLLDQHLLPYSRFNKSVFPSVDPAVIGAAPAVGSPGYATAVRQFIRQEALDVWNGAPVNFFRTFAGTVDFATAFPNGNGDAG